MSQHRRPNPPLTRALSAPAPAAGLPVAAAAKAVRPVPCAVAA